MRRQLMAFVRTLGEAAGDVQQQRRRRRDWRTDEWRERFDARDWGHVTGEIPTISTSR